MIEHSKNSTLLVIISSDREILNFAKRLFLSDAYIQTFFQSPFRIR
jgi:hypothetical protein